MDGRASVRGIAACTVEAAHRRDHDHGVADSCHPHTVVVVRLGRDAAAVCHDCGTDSGFVPQRDAERLAGEHRSLTRTDSVPLPRPASP